MKQKIYQIDAFTDKIFSGNPAAVCPLDNWLSDDILQKIAMENNLAETAFYVKQDNIYQIRWFSPTVEVDLCGHATLAAAYVLFNFEGYNDNTINFYSPRSGELTVTQNDELLVLNFPTDEFKQIDITEDLTFGFNIKPIQAFKGKSFYMLLFETEDQINKIIPALDKISKMNAIGVIVTAKGDEVDFVSRCFAPQSGINEDPATGSAHTILIPFWSKKLDKLEMKAIQLSKRKGYFQCKYLNERVEISGQVKLYLIGEIFLT